MIVPLSILLNWSIKEKCNLRKSFSHIGKYFIQIDINWSSESFGGVKLIERLLHLLIKQAISKTVQLVGLLIFVII
jgi:hypothetical protein